MFTAAHVQILAFGNDVMQLSGASIFMVVIEDVARLYKWEAQECDYSELKMIIRRKRRKKESNTIRKTKKVRRKC
jgi:hypothetical protein